MHYKFPDDLPGKFYKADFWNKGPLQNWRLSRQTLRGSSRSTSVGIPWVEGSEIFLFPQEKKFVIKFIDPYKTSLAGISRYQHWFGGFDRFGWFLNELFFNEHTDIFKVIQNTGYDGLYKILKPPLIKNVENSWRIKDDDNFRQFWSIRLSEETARIFKRMIKVTTGYRLKLKPCDNETFMCNSNLRFLRGSSSSTILFNNQHISLCNGQVFFTQSKETSVEAMDLRIGTNLVVKSPIWGTNSPPL